MNRLPNLDPLRFFLATFVILFHLPQLCRNQGLPYFDEWAIFHRGSEAVYLFFTLSGFLIIRLIYLEKEEGRFSIKRFYTRRILRIFPLYYLVLAFGLLFYNFILPIIGIPFEINYELWQGILLCTFFLPNVFSSLYEPGGILEILWSIGIEEQFYLLIAPLLFYIPRNRILLVLAGIAVGYFIIFHWNSLYLLRQFQMVFFFLFTGGIVSILEQKKLLEFFKKSRVWPVLFSLLTLCYFTTNWLITDSYWFNNLFLSLLFPMFLHSLAFNSGSFRITNKALIHLGNISYGIYMYHVIILNFVVFLFLKWNPSEKIGETSTILLINLFTIGLTIVISHFSFRYFESYFLKLKSKFRT